MTRLDRGESLARIRDRNSPWDVAIIGGGATGVAVALDAASRGLDVVLLERFDFGSGTSSRSTKLVHGGVRYLKQGNVTLVRDALRERQLLLDNAPHLVHDQPFLIPCRSLWQWFFYGVGLKLYDLLATRNSFGRSRCVTARRALELIPAMQGERLRGAVLYHDGQFDDARLLIDMARTAAIQGATLVNHMPCSGIMKDDRNLVSGVTAIDEESGETLQIPARTVVNAAGPFCDAVRTLDDADCQPMVAASQGIHLVLPKELYPGDTAMIVPKTSDGRVIFVVPWQDHAIVGTTDTAIDQAVAEPSPQPQEIQFLLETAAEYLSRPPTIDDVLSVFTGIRPLVKGDKSSRTASLSRDHVIRLSSSNLITITGGKWTTVRKMAEDCIDKAIQTGKLDAGACATKSLQIEGPERADLDQLESDNPELAQPIHPSLPLRRSQVVWAVRNEMARTVEDMLARRTRWLFLNSRLALEAAPAVAEVMAGELGTDSAWCDEQVNAFQATAQHYLPA
ncbi:Aerobic glycerol-3-phosphate dehydrogenase [Stieleria maiorica]|uniref:Aerobic glycerol-3-phosphate dehydrogenase n=1 Tax=Stieleria maiorica TaxID=2795974 RepID=A0A5B9MFK2_9BACT|nr:glycerol-3-phosphate dehydrogenase/oxidase [Stieleria maiorica]QEF98384.1 Aerobic glycerol-3-phosphate dehydrogenase [Stieleria maiorica]